MEETKRQQVLGVGLIIQKDGKFLLIRERLSDESLGKKTNMYAFPMGHVYIGENIFTAAERELKEETGYNAKVTSIVGFYDIKAAFGIAFEGELQEEEQGAFDKNEIIEVAWLTPEEIKNVPVRPAVNEAISDFISGKRYPLDVITFVL